MFAYRTSKSTPVISEIRFGIDDVDSVYPETQLQHCLKAHLLFAEDTRFGMPSTYLSPPAIAPLSIPIMPP